MFRSSVALVIALAWSASFAQTATPPAPTIEATASTSVAPSSSDAQGSADPSPAPASPVKVDFIHRLGRAYAADWAGTAPSNQSTTDKRRGTPEPLFSPPYPAADWPIGGPPVIGAIDEQSYPLMQALDGNKGKNKIFGWMEVGANGSTNNKTNAGKGIPSNFPSAYD